MQREDHSFNEGSVVLTTHDYRPGLMLWTTFITMVTEQLGSLTHEFRNDLRAQAEVSAAYYPQDTFGRYRLAENWREISAAMPDHSTLIIKAGPSIRLDFRLGEDGTISVESDLPSGEEHIRPFQYLPTSLKHAVRMAKGKTKIIVDLICRHLDPVTDSNKVINEQAIAESKTPEPQWWRDGGSRQSTRTR